jgi:nicotinamide phosphoribosyltransferase
MTHTSPLVQADAYKVSHEGFQPIGTEYIYSNHTARTSKYLNVVKEFYDEKTIFFGLQYFIKNFLIEEFNTKFFGIHKIEAIRVIKRRFDTFFGNEVVPMKRYEDLHDLGYLPLQIKALPEGAAVPYKVPYFTLINTHPDYAWLTNYLETIISCDFWKLSAIATIAREIKRTCKIYADKTTDDTSHLPFQIHGFEFRGMSGRYDAAACGGAFLLSSNGTDTIPAVDFLEQYYNADAEKEFIACSVPASEHSVSSIGTALYSELEFFRKAITQQYPTGIVSLVSDTYDYFKVITEYATALKEDILNRKVNSLGLAKVVFRPDSGDQFDVICGTAKVVDLTNKVTTLEKAKSWMEEELVEDVREETAHGEAGDSEPFGYFKFNNKTYKIVVNIEWNRHDKQYYYIDGSNVVSCEEYTLTPEEKGTIECLWDIFGGTISSKGYKVLNPRVGAILGDGCTPIIVNKILKGLMDKGFASSNIVFGIGSYTLQGITRDSIGAAHKATWAQINGVSYDIYKDPVTDKDKMKKSAKGLLRVDLVNGTYVLKDQCTKEEEQGGELKTVFLNGKLLVDHTLAEVRARVAGSLA